MKKFLAIILSIVMCSALVFTGCSDENELDTSIVATIGGVEVSQAEYNLFYMSGFESNAQQYGENWFNTESEKNGKTYGEKLKEDTITGIKEMIACEKIASEKGIKVEDAELDEYIRGIKEQQGGEQGYNSIKENYRTTDDALRKFFKRNLLANKLFEKIASEQKVEAVSEEEATSSFLANYANHMKVQHVLISTMPETGEDGKEIPAKSEEEALKIANEVIAKLDGGADFDSLIEEYNEDPGITKGKYYTFTSGEMVAEFEEATMNLQIGEYTKEPVKTDYGFHIIKRYEIVAEGEEFEAHKEQLLQQKKQVKANDAMTKLVDKKIKGLKVNKKDDVINEYLETLFEELGVDPKAAKIPYTEPAPQEMPVAPVPEEADAPAEQAPSEEASEAEKTE